MHIAMIGARSLPARHGGLEVAAEHLAVELADRGHTVRGLIDRRAYTGDFAGVQVEGVGAIRTKHLHALSQTFQSLPRLLRPRPDIAHFHGVGPAVLLGAPHSLHIPTVVTVQGLDWERDKWNRAAQAAFGAAAIRSLRRADAVIAVMRVLQRRLRARVGIESVYIPNGVTSAPGPPTDTSTLDALLLVPGNYILAVTRLVPEKGVQYLLDAYRRLSSSDVALVVVGTGATSYASAHERALRESAPPGVIFAGYRSGDALAQLFANAAIYVLPSVMEGLPLSLLEAMSYGLPVVHSEIMECIEVTRGDAALTFPARDSEGLARALDTLIADPALAARLGSAAKARVEAEYDWPTIATETEKLYYEITGARQPPATRAR
jgi:glycosyltransferase involved in cell wall biosynthesis